MSTINNINEQIFKLAQNYNETDRKDQTVLSIMDFLAGDALAQMMTPCETARDFTGMAQCAERTKERFNADPDKHIDAYLGLDNDGTHGIEDPIGKSHMREFSHYLRLTKMNKAKAAFMVTAKFLLSKDPNRAEVYNAEMKGVREYIDQCNNVLMKHEIKKGLGFYLYQSGCIERRDI